VTVHHTRLELAGHRQNPLRRGLGRRYRVRPRARDHQLSETSSVPPAELVEQPIDAGAVEAELRRPPNLAGIASDLAAGLDQLPASGRGLLEALAGRVLHIGVACGDPQRRRAAGADPHRRVGTLEGLWVGDRPSQLVVAAVEARSLLAPEQLEHPQAFGQPAHAVVDVDAEHLVLHRRPARADAELEATSREVIHGDGCLGQDRGVTENHAGNEQAYPGTTRRLGHRPEQRPTFENRSVCAIRILRDQVVECPAVVEARLIRDPPDLAVRLDRGVPGELEPDSHPMSLLVDFIDFSTGHGANHERSTKAGQQGGQDPQDPAAKAFVCPAQARAAEHYQACVPNRRAGDRASAAARLPAEPPSWAAAASRGETTAAGLPLPDGPFEAMALLEDPCVLVVPRDASASSPPSVEQWAGLDLIGFCRGRLVSADEDEVRRLGVEPRSVFRTEDNGTMQKLVAAGFGAALAPLLTVDETDPAVRVVRLEGFPSRRIGLAWHRDRFRSLAMEAFAARALVVCTGDARGADARPASTSAAQQVHAAVVAPPT
jgi:hypothetical protein